MSLPNRSRCFLRDRFSSRIDRATDMDSNDRVVSTVGVVGTLVGFDILVAW